MQLVIQPDGSIRCVYGETLDLHSLGSLNVARGSHVELDSTCHRFAVLSPVAGPRLRRVVKRSNSLSAETDWLEHHWLSGAPK